MAHSHDQDAPDCEAAIAEVYAYLDGEMTEERRVAIAHHLEGCSPCFEAFDFEAELRMVVQTHCRNDDVPESLRLRIVEELRVVTTGEDPDEADAAR